MPRVGQPDGIKVVHLITSLATGGAERFLARLLSATDRERFQNVVVSMTDEGAIGRDLRDIGVPVFALGMRRGIPGPLAFAKLLRLLRLQAPAVLQTWLYHSDLLGLVACRLAKVPHLVWNIRCSNTDDLYKTGLSGLTVRLLARYSHRPDAVIVNSEAGVKAHTALGYEPRRWEVIPNGINPEDFSPMADARHSFRRELGVDDGAVLIGLVARYDPLKDHATFLEAAAQVRHMDNVFFVLVGLGADKDNLELVSLIERLGLADSVLALGERGDIRRINAALDIATCSSRGEGFPNVIAEAMACGTPCVTTDVGDATEILGDAGVSVPPSDPRAFADAIRGLIQAGGAQRQSLGERARKRITEHYGLDHVARRYEALYFDLAANRSDASC